MTLKGININQTLEKAQAALENDRGMADSTRELMRLLLLCIQLLLERFGATSRNSSIPPSQDPNRKKDTFKGKGGSKKKPGGQKGHKGKTLQ